MADNPPRVLLVGHCGPDTYMLENTIRRAISDAEIVSVTQQRDLDRQAADLLVINRALDGSFETSSGVELIRQIAAQRPAERPAMVLVSNYADAQAEAEAAGAMPGFGKQNLYDDETIRRLQSALAAAHEA